MTTEQWLDLHRAEQAEADRYGEEYDLSNAERGTGHVVAPPRDIRETAVRDPGRDGDRRVRVPVIDETAAAVARAQAALAEIDARRAVDEAHVVEDAAQCELAEQERRSELSRWHANDTTAEHAADRVDEPDELIRE